jgi:hypothetical protein
LGSNVPLAPWAPWRYDQRLKGRNFFLHPAVHIPKAWIPRPR